MSYMRTANPFFALRVKFVFSQNCYIGCLQFHRCEMYTCVCVCEHIKFCGKARNWRSHLLRIYRAPTNAANTLVEIHTLGRICWWLFWTWKPRYLYSLLRTVSSWSRFQTVWRSFSDGSLSISNRVDMKCPSPTMNGHLTSLFSLFHM